VESTKVSIVSASRRAERRLADAGQHLPHVDVRQRDGQLVVGHRDTLALGIVLGAVDDGDGRAPVALAGDAPIAQVIVHRRLSDAAALRLGRDGEPRLLRGHAGELAGVEEHAVVGVRTPLRRGSLVRGAHHVGDGQAVLHGELVVALVVGGDGHHRAGAVSGEHEVRHPDRHLLAGERVSGADAGVEALLLRSGGALAQLLGGAPDLLGERPQLRGLLLRRQLQHQRMVRGRRHVGGAVDGVGAGGEDAEGLSLRAGDGELDLQAVGAADPVALHRHHALGPVDAVEALEQLVRVGGDAERPLRDLALDDHAAAAPAAPFFHLLVGEHGVAARAEVHLGAAAIDEAPLQHPQEEPLVPAIVGGIRGGDLRRPVDGDAERDHVLLEALDVLRRAHGRVHALLDRRVLGRQAEGIPTEGVEDVEAALAGVAGEHVGDAVDPGVPHVHLARGVREHGEHVLLGRAGARARPEDAGFRPVLLPA
jgi:hypothetical protein